MVQPMSGLTRACPVSSGWIVTVVGGAGSFVAPAPAPSAIAVRPPNASAAAVTMKRVNRRIIGPEHTDPAPFAKAGSSQGAASEQNARQSFPPGRLDREADSARSE